MQIVENDVYSPLKEWLGAHNPLVVDIDLDFDLIENRVIDSLAFMEFLLLIQGLIGREISFEEIQVDSFRTLRTIRKSFFNGD